MPIDVVPLHLLGQLLDDFSLLVVDEFAKFNSHDGSQEVQKLEDALNRLDEVYEKTARVRCSDFMGSSGYTSVLERLRPVIERNEELRNLALKSVPPKYRVGKNVLDYTMNEVACVSFLRSQGFRLKLGPDKERQYDKLMSVLAVNGSYGLRSYFQDLEFGYTLPAFSLSGKSAVPYVPNDRSDRVFLGESEQDVATKLTTASEKGLRYFATIGCIASSLRGGNYNPRIVQRLEGTRLLDVAVNAVISDIIRPYNGGRK